MNRLSSESPQIAAAVVPAGESCGSIHPRGAGDSPDPSCERLFLENVATVRQLVATVARHHGVPQEEAEDLTSLVFLKILSDDYAVLRKFRGDSSLRTYLTVVIERVYLDYRTAQWGKWRPTANARRHGSVAILFERLVARDGLSFDEACAVLESRGAGALELDTLERIFQGLRGRGRPRFVGDDELGAVAQGGTTADREVVAAEDRGVMARAVAVLQEALRDLPARDRLIVTLRFCDGMSVAAIARLLGLRQKPLYPRLARLTRCLRVVLESKGCGGTDVLAALERNAGETGAPGTGL